MATMDLIKYAGFEPANFLDVGGTADAKCWNCFPYYLKRSKRKAILINIFGELFVVTVWPGSFDAYKIWEMLLQCQSLFVYKVLMQRLQKNNW
jgi:succinyl-CoA synthetase beta subunit